MYAQFREGFTTADLAAAWQLLDAAATVPERS
jgi:hypothetical protein